MRKLRTWREYLIKQLAANWEEAFDYIQFAVEEYQIDGDTPVLLLSLETFIESQGGIEEVAKRAAMSPETLSKILSNAEAPRIDILATLLKSLGCRLTIEPFPTENPRAEIGNMEVSVAPIERAESNIELATESQ